MADVNGVRLEVGDRVEIVQMDEPILGFLVGVQGEVHVLPTDDDPVREVQVFLTLDSPAIPAISTQQAWVKKVKNP